MAGMAGIEPARAESKSAVLPLDYTPIYTAPTTRAHCKIQRPGKSLKEGTRKSRVPSY